MGDQVSSTKLYEYALNCDLILQCGKTYPALFPLMLDEILQQSSPHFETSGRVTSRGELLTLNTSEWPNDAAVCSLSQILEESAPPKYYLSARACQGILRRAERRGRALPPALQQALAQAAALIDQDAEEKTT